MKDQLHSKSPLEMLIRQQEIGLQLARQSRAGEHYGIPTNEPKKERKQNE